MEEKYTGLNGFWKGKIEATVEKIEEFNDKEHGRIFEAIATGFELNRQDHEKIWSRITDLRIRSTFFGFLGSGIGFAILYAASKVFG